VYVYRKSGNAFAAVPCVISSPNPMLCGSLALSMATTDSFFAIGSPYEGDPESTLAPLDSGGVYIFPRGGTY